MLTNREKLDRLNKLKYRLQSNQEELAQLIRQEVRKPLPEALAEVQKSVLAIDYVVVKAPSLDWNQILQIPEGYQVQLAPLGTVLAIEPWNFPMWQLFRVLPWNFWIGNRVLHKNSKFTQRLSDYLTPIIQDTLGQEFFESIYLPDQEVEAFIEDPAIQAVTLTGSTRAGRQVAARAGKALKKCVLELGGSDAFIVTEGADLGRVVSEAVNARSQNNGQSCIAAKRFIVHRSCYPKFIDALKSVLKEHPTVTLIHDEAINHVYEQISVAVQEGARPIWPKEQKVLPVILECLGNESFLKSFEFFAPVFCVMSFESIQDALKYANQTDYGLGASVWGATSDEKMIFSNGLQAGLITFDEIVRSHPAVPFGGIKDSGYGREMGLLGFLEFANIKIIKNP